MRDDRRGGGGRDPRRAHGRRGPGRTTTSAGSPTRWAATTSRKIRARARDAADAARHAGPLPGRRDRDGRGGRATRSHARPGRHPRVAGRPGPRPCAHADAVDRRNPAAGSRVPDAQPWLPPATSSRNVARQRDDPGSMLQLTRDLISLRRGASRSVDGRLRDGRSTGGCLGVAARNRHAHRDEPHDDAGRDAVAGGSGARELTRRPGRRADRRRGQTGALGGRRDRAAAGGLIRLSFSRGRPREDRWQGSCWTRCPRSTPTGRSPSPTSTSTSRTVSSSSWSGRPAAARRPRCGWSPASRSITGGDDLDRRPRGQRRAAEGARHRDGVPELRALSAHDRVRQHGVRPQAPQALEGGDRPAGAGGGRHPRARRAAPTQAEGTVGRSAAAGGDGPRDRPGAEGVPDGRAAVEPRREAPRADARRDRADPARAERHDHLRHPRPGRGDDDGRPGGGDPEGRSCSRSTRRSGSTTTRSTCSWPGSSARRP